MSMIDTSIFTGKINLAQTGNTSGDNVVQGFIDDYEPEFLQKALGYQLSKEFLAGIAIEPTDQKWLDLRDGVEYQRNGHTHKFIGLKKPCANYVYRQFIEDDAINQTLVGAATSETDNAKRVSPEPKIIDAWNQMATWLKDLHWFLDANKVTYPSWDHDIVYAKDSVYEPINRHGL
jgi:hypothetical protein